MKTDEVCEIHIDVTEVDIEYGVPCQTCRCPVARAIRRTTQTEIVNVTGCGVNINGLHAKFPVEVSQRIREFDETSKMKPFSFVLRLPRSEYETQRQGDERGHRGWKEVFGQFLSHRPGYPEGTLQDEHAVGCGGL